MSKEPILPWGTSGLDPTKGMQERNFGNLLKILEKKEATEALTAMAKVDKDTWGNIQNSVADLKDIAVYGGTGKIITSITTSITDSIKFIIDDKLSPITNTLDTIIADKLDPILNFLTDVSNFLAPYLANNDLGAFIGAMVGSIWGEGAKILGGIAGAAIEDLIKRLPEIFKGIWEWLFGGQGHGDYTHTPLTPEPYHTHEEYLAYMEEQQRLLEEEINRILQLL